MTHEPVAPAQPAPANSTRSAGIILITIAACEILFMAMHPTSSAHDVASFATEASRGVPGNAMVHGILITLLLIMCSAYITFAQFLGLSRLLVRTGLVAFLAASTCGIVAGLINGFIVPATAAAFAGADQATTNALIPVLRLCREANGVCAKTDVAWASAAILLWSVALLRRRGIATAAGIIGLICAIVPLALLATGHLPMNVRGFGTFVLLQGLFAAAAGAVLIRAK
ncbi:MAG: hypothetical protein NTV94_13740 [Planctomycetota bacterium]|nr:hypothetical protein [Planctomycetota bacterium]